MQYKVIDTGNYRQIMDKYHVGSLLAKIVSSFNYTEEELVSFFVPEKYGTYCHESFERIKEIMQEAKEKGLKVFVFGDYDCDGICATALMVRLLEMLGIENGYYIPNRFTEGYGLNVTRVMQASQKGYDVLITVDNGVSAYEALNYAGNAGMKVIVTDHHVISEEVNCDILCHPQLFADDYRYMCGTGVIYLLADYLGLADAWMKELAMIATIGDVMELKGFNVQLVREGLKLFNEHAVKCIDVMGGSLKYPCDETDMAFRIVPALNSIGRLADRANPNQAVRFLLTDDIREIQVLAQQIRNLNEQRKAMTSAQYELVRSLYKESEDFAVICDESLHEGITGILAGKLCDEMKKPCIVFTQSGELLKGSGRSIPSVDIFKTVSGFADRCVALGGHPQACGITIEKSRYDEFISYLKDNYHGSEYVPVKECIELNYQDLTRENIDEVFRYSPYGQGRKIPVLRLADGTVIKLSLRAYNGYYADRFSI